MEKFTEIRRLLHDRRNLDAFYEASQWLTSDPQGREPRLIMAYCLKNLCEEAAEKGDPQMFVHYYAIFPSLRIDQLTGQEMMPNRFAWAIKKMADSLQRQPALLIQWMPRILDMARCHVYVRPERYYSSLLEAAMKVHAEREKGWTGFYDFMKWWGFGSFSDGDYQKIDTQSGHKMASLADRAHTACYHSIALQLKAQPGDTAAANEFIEYLDALIAQRRAFTNTAYHKARLLLQMDDKKRAMAAIKLYLRFQNRQFWGWDLLGDCLEDPAMRLACYCRALCCRANPNFLAPVRVKAALMMAELGLHANARHEADRAIRAYQDEGWKIKGALEGMMSEDWFRNSAPAFTNEDLYQYYASYSDQALAYKPQPLTPNPSCARL